MSLAEEMKAKRAEVRALQEAAPEAMRAFYALVAAVKQDGALGLKEKEFVALGIAVEKRCAPCIAHHLDVLKKAGASRAEIVEVLAMAIQMGGAPTMMQAAGALAAWDELTAP